MRPVAGVFRSGNAARNAAAALRDAGFAKDQINVLYPGASEQQVHSVPTTDTEQPGVGAAIGGVVGAAAGMAGGFELGTAAATALLPGIGPVIAVGIAGAALLGAGGLVGGAKLGGKADQDTAEGLPADEVYFYEDALRQGRSVVIVLAPDEAGRDMARTALARSGAESLDGARDDWWVGIRDVEAEHYRSLGHNFETDQKDYRAGFEAALRKDCRDCTTEDELRQLFPDMWGSAAFREGFARGRAYLESRGPSVQ
ncbi:MAG: hypothetical protein U0Q18_21860 [Bryobacteraceae bacterium]